MIPKIIHYCWFGNNPIPENVIVYINSWKEKCPDYKIFEWNEKNFDFSLNMYAAEAYNEKKWAFVSDYVRIYALYNYGGIYLDTDVEVLRNFDDLLNNKAFLGFETISQISTGIIGAEKENKLIKLILDNYSYRRFIKEDGTYDLLTNVDFISKLINDNYNILFINKYQKFDDFAIYPSDYLSPKDNMTGEIEVTPNSICIHHFDGTWVSSIYKKRIRIQQRIYSLFGKNKFSSFLILLSFFILRIKTDGFMITVKYLLKKQNKQK